MEIGIRQRLTRFRTKLRNRHAEHGGPIVTANARARDNIRVDIYHVGDLARTIEQSESPLDIERLVSSGWLAPDETITSRNTTCIGLDEYRALNLSAAGSNVNEVVTNIALGSDASAQPAHGNRALNNQFGNVDVGSFDTTTSGTLTCTGYVGPSIYNNQTFREVGLKTGSGRLLNHSTIDPVEKSAQKAITITVNLTFDTDTGDA